MNDKSENAYLDGEVVDGDRSSNHLSYELDVPELGGASMLQAVRFQAKAWGIKRSLDAFRELLDRGTAAANASERHLQARRDLETEKERWNNIDVYRDNARLEADNLIKETQAKTAETEQRINDANKLVELAKLDTKIIQADLQDFEEARAHKRKLDKIVRAAELAEAEARLERAQNNKPKTLEEKLAAMAEIRKEAAQLEAEKQKDIERFGSEANFPHYVTAMYRQLEADLSEGLGDE